MKTMKKVLLVLVSLALVLSMAGAVAAADLTQDDYSSGATATATVDIGSKFKLTLPAEIPIGTTDDLDSSLTNNVVFANTLLDSDDTVTVTVASNTNMWRLKSETKEDYISYELKSKVGTDAATVVSGTSGSDTDMATGVTELIKATQETQNPGLILYAKYAADTTTQYAGKYQDTVTFTITFDLGTDASTGNE